MISIYKNDYYEMVKTDPEPNPNPNPNETKFFFIRFKTPNKSLALSLIKTGILSGGTITDDYQNIHFRAFSAKPLIEKPSIINKNQLAQNLLFYLSKQFDYLITKENKSFYQLNLENIIIIDNSKIGYIDSKILEISEIKHNHLHILNPFSKNKWDSPELWKITSLPAKVHYKTVYYSLALITLTILFDTIDLDTLKVEEETIVLHLNKIKETSLFYTLKRCLQKDPNQRSIIYI